MKKIDSFKIDHTRLEKGIFVSRVDSVGNSFVTTFDIRMVKPSEIGTSDVALRPEVSHTIEHLGAMFLRNHEEWGWRIVYFGPMGCLTGFYLLVDGDWESSDILPLVKEMFEYIENYDDEIPGYSAEECGNYLFHNLRGANLAASNYLPVLNHPERENLEYPD